MRGRNPGSERDHQRQERYQGRERVERDGRRTSQDLMLVNFRPGPEAHLAMSDRPSASPTASVAWKRSWLQLARQKPQDLCSENGPRFLLKRHIQCKCDSGCNWDPTVPSPCPKGMSLPAWSVDRAGRGAGCFRDTNGLPPALIGTTRPAGSKRRMGETRKARSVRTVQSASNRTEPP